MKGITNRKTTRRALSGAANNRPRHIFLLLSGLLLLLAASCTQQSEVTQNQPAANANRSPKTAPPNGGTVNNPNAVQTANAEARPAVPDNILASPVTLLDGKKVTLNDYKGKVVLVNYWATWCGPCRNEIPHLIAVSEEYKDKGFEVMGVTIQGNDPDPNLVRQFTQQFKIPYSIGYAEPEFILGLQLARPMNNIPQSFIISRDGHVFHRFVGFGAGTPAQLREVIEAALKDTAEEKKAA